ncbi:TetR/AcrR family transcriptional regulator [Brenneria tiliae]|uniref:TetR/AcrR family transcriptional regulator n=1 Tax=Brenneria tiliae TaxID=2914984 RepID=A0ABT0MY37_9GAMM|nr:TetR/AcrR family transcriptional regulator [Brenneria tiliae]MCL2894753.1 TetR/AcrR family transcriptional regulator [Brenneria tiliae]MCL2898430.1 TetR/AcrR family transcriptional regulator [Brenneria tiliae]MCL2903028.1 TetR/AcrR family transcriptional regulator [Brenneria tiliae]
MIHIKKNRSDAVRHRAILLDAAARVFARQGAHVSLDAVVAAAGMGRATLYRHFPDRTALLLALFDRDIAPVLNVGKGMPPGEVLLAMLTEIGRVTHREPSLEAAWRAIEPSHPGMQERRRDLLARFEQPLADAIAAGKVRADLTLDDVVSVGRMIASATRLAPDDDAAGARILDLALNGVRSRD